MTDDVVQCPSCGVVVPYDDVETGLPNDWEPDGSESLSYYESTPSRCPACGADMQL